MAEKERTVGQVWGKGKEDTTLFGTKGTGSSSEAESRAYHGMRRQLAIEDMYKEGSATLLTSALQEDQDRFVHLLETDILTRESGTMGGFTFGYDEILGEHDPTSFLEAYRGYVATRGEQVQQAKARSKTFLTGEF